MKVIVLGSGVIGTTAAYYLAQAGHEVDVVDRQPAPAWRRASRMPARSRRATLALGAPGVPLKALKWMLMEHARWSSGRSSTPPCGAGASRCCELHRGALPRQQEPDGAPRRVQPRLPERRCATTPASTTTSAARARCSSFARSSSSTPPQRTSRCCGRSAFPTKCSIPTADPRSSRRWRRCANKIVGGAATAGRRDRRLLQVHQRLAAMAARLGVTFRFGVTIHGSARRRRNAGVRTDRGTLHGRRGTWSRWAATRRCWS